MRNFLENLPILGPLLRPIAARIKPRHNGFIDSKEYWISRYASGGNSGDGSYRQLAEFKAEILNDFVNKKGVRTVIEFGCGDGNQLKLSNYPQYVGFDVSSIALNQCREKFREDDSKRFDLVSNYSGEIADLAISLDVIYHLIEDAIFEEYMEKLFDASSKYVAIYSSNANHGLGKSSKHVKHRKFSDWIAKERPEWVLMEKIANRYPFNGDTKTGSFADFYFYKKEALGGSY